ncbi:MAG: hypothetical protein A2V70_07060 [Planctomycetes bacterium RBG_13_63_9]|nr:MAG: hypothetical protein A2V70_07060 [Planctomycetes bacterium RBG_13_63_9]
MSIRPVPEDRATYRPGADPQRQPTVRMVWTLAEVGPANSEEDLPDGDAPFLDIEQPMLAPRESGQSAGGFTARPNQQSEEPDRAEREGPRTLIGPVGTLLPPPDEPTRRSEQLERIARQADRQIHRGFGLASRRAYFAARAEFVRALRLVAQGLDAERRTTTHGRSLAAGLKAIEESEDFIPEGSRLEADLDLGDIIAGHGTPVLKDVDTQRLTPLSALRCYFTFAQEQLAAAAGREVAGSMALHALGKVHGALARHKVGDVVAAEPKAMVFFQAALLVYPGNYMAANDLGVLLANSGEYPEARTMLVRSLSICSQSAGWLNLAVVHEQLGEFELARVAREQFATTRRAEIARWRRLNDASQRRVDWVDSDTFARTKAERGNVWQSSLQKNRK